MQSCFQKVKDGMSYQNSIDKQYKVNVFSLTEKLVPIFGKLACKLTFVSKYI